ncbi:hypothetical protein [Wolbachia endosymbiont (group A) of Lasioglossum morio]|uniref:hypothetical protein n=1 Tax=Wolbachia endosymbiont (group A) of Lasioglossum morio TaxID=2954025 RepID=UPI00222726DD|nr:hypothetical protein [Wolbachia endosymbiont (group A) of Lasioglossum morio]
MKETFSSEKEKITCKGAMEVAGTQPYKRCNIAQYYTVNDVIPVPSFLSSQCVTLGSSFSYNLVKNVCFSIRQLFLCLSAQCAHLQSNFWIPVSGHWNDTLLVAQCSYSCVSVTFMTSDEL